MNNIEQVKIADITFGYANQKLIAALDVRGKAIAHNKFDKVRKESKKIAELVADEKIKSDLTRPTAAFIVFEEEEGAATALKSTKKKGETEGFKFHMKFD